MDKEKCAVCNGSGFVRPYENDGVVSAPSQAENERLREALQTFCDAYDRDDGTDAREMIEGYMKAREAADKALLGGK